MKDFSERKKGAGWGENQWAVLGIHWLPSWIQVSYAPPPLRNAVEQIKVATFMKE